MSGSGRRMPNRAAARAAWAACEAASRALLGTQPKLRQSPPIRSRSISATRRPSCAATAVTERPDGAGADHRQVELRHPDRFHRRQATGSSDNAASPISGPRMRGEKTTVRSGLPPVDSTSPRPAPIEA